MGLLDKLLGRFGGESVDEDKLSQAPLDDEMEDELRGREEEIQRLRSEIQKKEQDESARTARLEERLQEQEQEKKKLQQQLSDTREEIQSMQKSQSRSTVSTPPPDTQYLEGKPVVSADGNKNFGKFKGWINERDKVGIKCDHPRRDNKIEKVGWADSIRDLVMDASNLREKEIIIVKLDYRGEKIDYVSVHRHKEVLQKKERLEDQKSRLSMENDELIKQNRKLEKLNQKLITTMSMDRMEEEPDNGSKDMVISKMANQREMDKARMDNLSDQRRHTRGRTEEIISEYERAMDGRMGDLTRTETDQAISEVGELLESFSGEMQAVLSQLDPETREDLLSALGGSSGGSIAIKEE